MVAGSDRMPCLPDNLHWDKHSTTHYWAGCGGPIRTAGSFSLFDFSGALPALRQLIVYLLPHSLIGALIRPEAMVVRMRIVNSSYHQVSDVLMDRRGERLHTTTSAVWRAADDKLWLTSFKPVSHIQPATHRSQMLSYSHHDHTGLAATLRSSPHFPLC